MFTTSCNKKGFTLLETLISISVGAIIFFMMVGAFAEGLKIIRHMNNNYTILSNAEFILNTLDYSIKSAKEISVPNSTELNIDSGTIIIKLDGNNIKKDGIVLNANDVKVNSLHFTRMTKSVRISFELQKGTAYFSIATTIAKRN